MTSIPSIVSTSVNWANIQQANTSSTPTITKTRTDLQKWSSCRNWSKRKLTKAFFELGGFLEFNKSKLIDSNPVFNVKYSLLTEEEIDKLTQAYKLMEEVRNNYRSNYFKARDKTDFKRK